MIKVKLSFGLIFLFWATALQGANRWTELPDQSVGTANSKIVTHYTTINSKQVRNYTMLYDTVNMMARWVAYPLHVSYLGTYSRSDKWVADPQIDKRWQPSLKQGFPEQQAGKNRYDRGHQLPSADRTVNEATNAQTFFYSNATAQEWSLNQGVWKSLEDKVRGLVEGTTDTLYVVTGAVLGSPVRHTKDRAGHQIAVPQYYYKALLKVENGEYKTICYWFKNEKPNSRKVGPADMITLPELEKRTGLVFFPTIEF